MRPGVMVMNPKAILGLLKETFKEWKEDNASRLAAALSYYMIFSLAPVLIIAIAIVGSIFGEEAAKGEIVEQIQGLVGEQGAQFIQTAITNANRPDASGGLASLISIVVLLFGASGVFGELQDALNTIWDVKLKPGRGIWGILKKRILSFLTVLGVGLFLLLSAVISTALSAVRSYKSEFLQELGLLWLYQLDFVWTILDLLVSFGILSLMFALVYKYLPDVKIAWKDVWVGAIITTLLFNLGKWLLSWYLGRSSFSSSYGAAGSLVVLLAWVYYSSQIIFLGAEFTQVYAKIFGSKIVPDDHATPLPAVGQFPSLEERDNPRS
ncbi:MAG: YihY/virulence factor BrkB family protein [Moorea sp. SIO3B2]|uniref:YihY/virulence factor BrkB family protein n=2 Tax=unclassified Moorena TaxID=2683338 RepID=UPI0013BA6170|nr:YihY/virulence factor BrkB family protein [Moorena sp. SIO4E2]NEP35603.1 YihY/virulence factor BrkB family protein [Moorena sp. SIO3B2]NEQ08368.1 YihY/virulence factor BrkB family protein [Moorena sp. SIO4E2]